MLLFFAVYGTCEHFVLCCLVLKKPVGACLAVGLYSGLCSAAFIALSHQLLLL